MGKVKIFCKAVGKAAKKNAPTIMMVTGISGMLTTVILACNATPKAQKLIDKAYEEKNAHSGVIFDDASCTVEKPDEDLTVIETVKAAIPAYWPAGLTFLTSAGLIIFANSVNLRRNAALLAAAELSETALKDWQKKTLEMVDKDTGDQIKSAVYKDQVERRIQHDELIENTGMGNTVCMDSVTGKMFYSDRVAIDKAINYLNALLLEEGEACLNDFFDYLKVSHSDIGYILGWKYADKHDLVSVACHYISLANGDPCLVIEYSPKPDYDFRESTYHGY